MITSQEIYKEIKKFEDCILLADPLIMLNDIQDLAKFDGKGLAFYKGKNPATLLHLKDTNSGLIITSQEFHDVLKKGPFLLVKDPQRAFIHAARLLIKEEPTLIHPTAIIHKGAKIGLNVSIGAYSVIGNVEIGDHSLIGSHVSIKDKVRIGKNAIIMNGAIIGEPGLGSRMDYDGNQILFPHIGGVNIGDHFVLGSGSIVNCGALSDTIIGNHVHISSNCLVAHNCRLGNNVYLAASAQVAGAVKIGDRSYVGFSAIITDGVEIAEGVTIGVGATIMNSVTDKDTTLMNQPQVKSLGKLFSIKRQ